MPLRPFVRLPSQEGMTRALGSQPSVPTLTPCPTLGAACPRACDLPHPSAPPYPTPPPSWRAPLPHREGNILGSPDLGWGSRPAACSRVQGGMLVQGATLPRTRRGLGKLLPGEFPQHGVPARRPPVLERPQAPPTASRATGLLPAVPPRHPGPDRPVGGSGDRGKAGEAGPVGGSRRGPGPLSGPTRATRTLPASAAATCRARRLEATPSPARAPRLRPVPRPRARLTRHTTRVTTCGCVRKRRRSKEPPALAAP